MNLLHFILENSIHLKDGLKNKQYFIKECKTGIKKIVSKVHLLNFILMMIYWYLNKIFSLLIQQDMEIWHNIYLIHVSLIAGWLLLLLILKIFWQF
jgi:hypothetical protein